MQLDRTSNTTYTDVVSLAAAKAHLRVDHSSEDDLIVELVKTAGEVVEEYTGLYLASSGWKLYADCFEEVMRAYIGPKASVSSIQYWDTANVLQTVDTANYYVDNASYPVRIQFDPDPTDVDDRVNAVQITGTAGYATVPSALKQAMLLIIGHLYEHRKDVVVGVGAAPLPMGARYLMDKHRPQTL